MEPYEQLMSPQTTAERRPNKPLIVGLLARQGLNQAALARRIGFSRQYLCAVINGTRRVTERSPLPERVAEALSVPVDAIFPVSEVRARAA